VSANPINGRLSCAWITVVDNIADALESGLRGLASVDLVGIQELPLAPARAALLDTWSRPKPRSRSLIVRAVCLLGPPHGVGFPASDDPPRADAHLTSASRSFLISHSRLNPLTVREDVAGTTRVADPYGRRLAERGIRRAMTASASQRRLR